jgi:hypothetical protein
VLFKQVKLKSKQYYSIPHKGSADWEIYPTTNWNYALILNKEDPNQTIEVHHNPIQTYPFSDIGDQVYNTANNRFEILEREAPVVLSARGILIPDWKMYKNSAAHPPVGRLKTKGEPEEVFLVPYGCTRLRISEFPFITDSF